MPNIVEVWEDHTNQEFALKDTDAAMRTMTEHPMVNHVPVMTGGLGRDRVAQFYRDHFVGQNPGDFSLQPISRTVGETSLVDEFICGFTHDVAMDWMLPGVRPTGRKVRLPVVAVIGFESGRIAFERIYWDQASVLVQVGLLDPAGLPVTGAEAADMVADPASAEANRLIKAAA
jgi:carboxymethylenebutenolidase